MWKSILFGLVVISIIVVLSKRRTRRLLVKENQVREKLGLPVLTEAEFAIEPVEKSVDYRGKINQHM